MTRNKISYTKVFVPVSILNGLTYDEIVMGSDGKGMTEIETSLFIEWAQAAKDIPVIACAGSNYTVTNVTVTEIALAPQSCGAATVARHRWSVGRCVGSVGVRKGVGGL